MKVKPFGGLSPLHSPLDGISRGSAARNRTKELLKEEMQAKNEAEGMKEAEPSAVIEGEGQNLHAECGKVG